MLDLRSSSSTNKYLLLRDEFREKRSHRRNFRLLRSTGYKSNNSPYSTMVKHKGSILDSVGSSCSNEMIVATTTKTTIEENNNLAEEDTSENIVTNDHHLHQQQLVDSSNANLSSIVIVEEKETTSKIRNKKRNQLIDYTKCRGYGYKISQPQKNVPMQFKPTRKMVYGLPTCYALDKRIDKKHLSPSGEEEKTVDFYLKIPKRTDRNLHKPLMHQNSSSRSLIIMECIKDKESGGGGRLSSYEKWKRSTSETGAVTNGRHYHTCRERSSSPSTRRVSIIRQMLESRPKCASI